MHPAFWVEFKYKCIILHEYCVIAGVVVVPQEASSSPSTGAFGRFRALRALSRRALGSSPAPPPPPPPPPRLAPPLRLRAAARRGVQRGGRRSPGGCARGRERAGRRGRAARTRGRRLGPPSSGAAGRARDPLGAGKAAWPLPSLPSPKLRSPPGPDSLMIQRILQGRPGRGRGAGAERLGRRTGAAAGARAGIRAVTEAATAPRARRPLPWGRGSRCMGPGAQPCCAARRRRTPQAGWG